mmetsp:Transcript_86946/g.243693  ORF Transcript_86946/g.243693 Transcript_86946/m.243693 type:complete len:233 (+) Transcript_86946:1084-1782(+)
MFCGVASRAAPSRVFGGERSQLVRRWDRCARSEQHRDSFSLRRERLAPAPRAFAYRDVARGRAVEILGACCFGAGPEEKFGRNEVGPVASEVQCVAPPTDVDGEPSIHQAGADIPSLRAEVCTRIDKLSDDVWIALHRCDMQRGVPILVAVIHSGSSREQRRDASTRAISTGHVQGRPNDGAPRITARAECQRHALGVVVRDHLQHFPHAVVHRSMAVRRCRGRDLKSLKST